MLFYWKKYMESTQKFLLDFLKTNPNLTTPFVVATKEQSSGIGSRGNTWQSVECGLYFSCALHKTLLPKDLPLQSLSIYFGFIFLEIFREINPNVWLKWPNDFYIQQDDIQEQYKTNTKVGGILTHNLKDFIVFGIGLNLVSSNFCALFQDFSTKDSLNTQNIYTSSQKKYQKNGNVLQNQQRDWILYAIIEKILDFLSFNIVKCNFTNDEYKLECNNTCVVFLQEKFSWQEIFKKYQNEFYKNGNFKAHINNENGITQEVFLRHAKLQNDGSILLHNKILHSLR
ncbi:biotin--[acetyl-CoA-carboxylase] ligase [Helicobacter didelphidarum]|uniref:Biotin--[acetyl-CoA-carboxylase] ligase n=1 Tax=Helicobacter didelphidarum TaxID=2040648 RepID=A0A3D8IEL7_9HELI|nr:biotin--[acetyl-CoA-carboxylase] ligase [Helicobacter didelphidarum]RDU63445.1 biotin--[acetyl-CoA-carboxylase] ligase [Helicobacter didelphidarum]